MRANGVSCLTGYARRVRSLLALLATGAALLACNDHGAGTLTAIKTEVCACTTATCAEQAIQRVPQREIAANRRNQTTARDMLDCLAKLQAAERPSTDPDEEADAEAAGTPAIGSAAASAPAAAGSAAAAPASAAGPKAAGSAAAPPTSPSP